MMAPCIGQEENGLLRHIPSFPFTLLILVPQKGKRKKFNPVVCTRNREMRVRQWCATRFGGGQGTPHSLGSGEEETHLAPLDLFARALYGYPQGPAFVSLIFLLNVLLLL